MDCDDSGILHLLKKLDNTVADELNDKTFTLTAQQTDGKTASTSVTIVVLPSCYGDKFVPLVKMEQDSIETGSHFEHITPRALLRFLRQPSKTGRKIALAQLKLQRKIATIKKMITLEIGKQCNFYVMCYILEKQVGETEKMHSRTNMRYNGQWLFYYKRFMNTYITSGL